MMRSHIRGLRDRGSVSLEALIIAPVMFLIVDLTAAAGQIAYAKSVVQEAAQKEVRIVSEARDRTTAFNNIDTSYRAYESSDKLVGLCVNNTVPNANGGAFSRPTATTGAASLVSVTITCDVDLSAFPLLTSLQGVVITVTAYSPLDPYRVHGLYPGG